MIAVFVALGVVAVGAFVIAAGRVSAAECCHCPYECPEHRAEYPEP